MSKTVQVVLSDEECEFLEAQRGGESTSATVRRILRLSDKQYLHLILKKEQDIQQLMNLKDVVDRLRSTAEWAEKLMRRFVEKNNE